MEFDELADNDEGKQTSRGAHVPYIHILFSLLTRCFYLHYISLSIFSHTFISFLSSADEAEHFDRTKQARLCVAMKQDRREELWYTPKHTNDTLTLTLSHFCNTIDSFAMT